MGAYARARLAEADRALPDAASAYRLAMDADPDDVEIARRAYRQGVLAGDKALALRAAHVIDAAGQLPRDGTVLLLADALDRRKWDEARALIDRIDDEQNLGFVVPFMNSWVSMRDGPYDPPVIAAAEPYAGFALRYLDEQLLLQRLTLGDVAGAAEAYAQAKARNTVFGGAERTAMAARFAELGRRDLALDLIAGDGITDPEAALAAAQKRYRDVRTSPQTGLARLMVRLGRDLFGQGDPGATFSIMRVASFADPADEDVRLGVAQAALNADHPDLAYQEAAKLPPASPDWLAAQAVQLRALMARDRDAEAVAQAQRLAAGGDPRAVRLLGDTLMQHGDFAAAADAFQTVRAAQTGKDDPALLLQLGGALERAGAWAKARPILEKLVTLVPDSAPALNYLGYALADRGEDLPHAIALLERANRLRPQEAAFVDSLGWAFYRAGQYDKALPLISDAVSIEPDNAEINEHLGDLLWATGRHFEARYAWRAAIAVLEPGGEAEAERNRIVRKIDLGGAAIAHP